MPKLPANSDSPQMGDSRPPYGSPSSLMVDGCPMVEGSAKAMSNEIASLGIMRQKHCACHACGKQVSASDGYPIIKEKYRYSIQCDSCDEIVYGHSVDSVWRQWVALYQENVQTEGPAA